MVEFVLVLFAIIAIILTVWMLVIPVEVVAGFVKALRNGDWRRRKQQ